MKIVALLLGLLAAAASAESPSTAGFISIDCGVDDVSSYSDDATGLVYSSDQPYTSTGVNMKVLPDPNLAYYKNTYATLRSFPDGERNCYTLQPVLPGTKYRLAADFFYGNYDGLYRPPIFDLHLGVNLWETVKAGQFYRSEIITIAATDKIQVCLVNSGGGKPFISELNLRPLPFSLYNLVNDTTTSITVDGDRIDYGGQDQSSFPEDAYDRLWVVGSDGKNISTTDTVQLLKDMWQVGVASFSLTR